MLSKVFLDPNNSISSLDDDLCGARARDAPVRTLSARNITEKRIAPILSPMLCLDLSYRFVSDGRRGLIWRTRKSH